MAAARPLLAPGTTARLQHCSTHCRTQLGDNIYNQWQSRRRSFSVQSKPFLACKNTFLVTSFLVSDVWLCSRQGHSCRSTDLTLLLSSTLVDSVHNVLTNCWYQDITGMTPPWPWFSVECRTVGRPDVVSLSWFENILARGRVLGEGQRALAGRYWTLAPG